MTQQLKDAVRFERAKDLLLRTTKPIKQVAAASGFRNEKSLMRAFREWAGASPDYLPGVCLKPHTASLSVKLGDWVS